MSEIQFNFIVFMGYWWTIISAICCVCLATGFVLNFAYRKMQDTYSFYELSQAVQQYKKELNK